MNDVVLARLIATIIAQSVALVLAVTGETITERGGVINLSLDGTIMLTSMAGFVVAFLSRTALAAIGIQGDALPLLLGFLIAALVGALPALLIAWGSIQLKQNQVAIGFVLTMLLTALANFLGQNYTGVTGPSVPFLPIPLLKDIPLLGKALFSQNLLVYLTFIILALVWWWMYRTQPGLKLRGIGERPESAFARGVPVNRLRYLYAALGGMLVGLAGACITLRADLGWDEDKTLGLGWIALAIVIFGGWHPLRGAAGVLLFAIARSVANAMQQSFADVPAASVLFNSLQWLMMLVVLLLVGSGFSKQIIDVAPKPLQRPLTRLLRVAPPQGLGQSFIEE